MQGIRCRDVDDVDVRAIDHVAPIGLCLLPAPLGSQGVEFGLSATANEFELQVVGCLEKVVDLTKSVGMGFGYEPGTDHGEAKRV